MQIHPEPHSAIAVPRGAHGLVPDRIHPAVGIF